MKPDVGKSNLTPAARHRATRAIVSTLALRPLFFANVYAFWATLPITHNPPHQPPPQPLADAVDPQVFVPWSYTLAAVFGVAHVAQFHSTESFFPRTFWMQCLACCFRITQANSGRIAGNIAAEWSGRSPVSLGLPEVCLPNRVWKTLPMFGCSAPDDCLRFGKQSLRWLVAVIPSNASRNGSGKRFRCSGAALPMIASVSGSSASQHRFRCFEPVLPMAGCRHTQHCFQNALANGMDQPGRLHPKTLP